MILGSYSMKFFDENYSQEIIKYLRKKYNLKQSDPKKSNFLGSLRMYGVFLFGYLSEDREILDFMKKEVSKDENWRVQEVLAKSFDEYCRKIGYEEALSVIDEWLGDVDPNTRRAVTWD